MLFRSRAEVKQDADRAVSARQAATQSETKTKASESAAATSESNAKTSETNAKQSETNAGDYAAVATTAATEAVDAMDAAALSAAAFSIYTGIGSPEGKVTAPVGSVYTDSAATNGAIRWIKTAGTETTGWRVEYGDTGWRNITSLLRSGWTATTFLMRRHGSTVDIRATGLNGSSATDFTFFVPPEGFMPGAGSLRIPASTSGSSVNADRVNIGVSGVFSQVWRTNINATSVALSTTYLTNEPWPTTLPAAPA